MEKPDRVKYHHSQYSDCEIDGLMRYFKFDTYVELLEFMRKNYKSD